MYLMRLLCKLVNLSSVKDKKDSNGSQSKCEIVYNLGVILTDEQLHMDIFWSNIV